MTRSLSPEAVEGDESAPHRMRITSGGSMEVYVRFALNFLLENPQRPLVLHTLPPDVAKISEDKTSGSASSSSTLHACTLATPRLVSVAEKIKRDFTARLRSLPREGRPKGIWQYTESGLLPAPAAEPLSLDRVLAGKTKPKMTHRPYLQITLSSRALGLETKRNVTCQSVLVGRRRGKGKSDKEEPGAIEQTKPAGTKRKSGAADTAASKRARTAAGQS